MFFRRNIFFNDRLEAGQLLLQKLQKHKNHSNTVVLGIPMGGLVTAKPISEALNVPLSVVITKKVGAPGQNELAIGAVGPEGSFVLDKKLIAQLSVNKNYLNKKIEDLKIEIMEKEKKFNNGNFNLKGKKAILVDDGIATGSTVEVAIKFLRKKRVAIIVLAVPVLPKSAVAKFKILVDELVYLSAPENFTAVGQFYEYFPKVTSEEVVKLLK